MNRSNTGVEIMPGLANHTIRDLVAIYPDVMTVLAPRGIDLCCGGAHGLGEALDLHGIEREPVLLEIERIIAGAKGKRA